MYCVAITWNSNRIHFLRITAYNKNRFFGNEDKKKTYSHSQTL